MQQIADKMNFQDPVQKYAECHSWDMSNSNATKYHEIKVGILVNTCFKENVPTFEILVGWILRLGLNFWVINVALCGWKCDPAYQRQKKVCTLGDEAIVKIHKKLFSGIPINFTFFVISPKLQRIWSWNFEFATRKIWAYIWYQKMYYFPLSPGEWECDRHKVL